MATCKKCGTKIQWVKTKREGWIPCEDWLVEYHAGNTPDFEDRVISEKGEVIQCTFDFQCDPDGLARIPHWRFCPFADECRGRNKHDAQD